MWEIEFTDEFERWWNTLSETAQDSIAVLVTLLEEKGVSLGYPYSSEVKGTKRISHLRELRDEVDSRILRVIYAFDPRRKAILLIGGDKRGDKNWYDTIIPIAEEIYLNHLKEISRELEGGKLNGSKI